MPFLTTMNMLLQATHLFSRGEPGDRELAVSCLVAAEQRIVDIEAPLQFLAAQNAADKVWEKYLLETGLATHSSVPPAP